MRTVRDIMQPEVIAVRTGTTIQELVQLLDEEGISGVPVLDSSGKVRGVVSRTDVVRHAAHAPEVPRDDQFWAGIEIGLSSTPRDDDDPHAFFLSPESTAVVVPGANSLESIELAETEIDEIMTPVAFDVDPEMTIWELARFLVQGRIHRALVVEDERLVGIVTAFDVLRVVAGDQGG